MYICNTEEKYIEHSYIMYLFILVYLNDNIVFKWYINQISSNK